jgi:magnesium transporter
LAQIDAPRISVVNYDETRFEEKDVGGVADLAVYLSAPGTTWIDVRGLSDPGAINSIGDLFKLHPLTVEDIINTSQRPKMEDLMNYVFVSVKVLRPRRESVGGGVSIGQVSLVIGKKFVLSFKEDDNGLFEPIREKLRKYKGRIRKMGSDYLAYRLLGTVIDGYFAILEDLGERLSSLEDKVVTDPNPKLLRAVHSLRIQMTSLYRSVWPLREVIGSLNREELPVIRESTETYFRDLYDHTVQIIETMETDREMISDMLDIYVSSMSNRMNEIMKVLTVIATIFIPMTFLAGVWGMNFKYMPELNKQWAYPAFWLLIVTIAVFMLLYFRRKKWL